MQNKHDHLFKVVMIGSPQVGKSSILSRLTRNDFDLKCNSTIGVEYSSRDIIQNDQKILRIQIWDPIVGQKFSRIQKPYFRGAVAVLFVFDLCNKTTLQLNSLYLNMQYIQQLLIKAIQQIFVKLVLYKLNNLLNQEGLNLYKHLLQTVKDANNYYYQYVKVKLQQEILQQMQLYKKQDRKSHRLDYNKIQKNQCCSSKNK